MKAFYGLILLGGTALAQTTQRVSLGGDTNRTSSLSADGRFMAFDGEPNNTSVSAVYVRDFQTGTTELISIANDGGPANQGSGLPSISADGRYVAFGSGATNLVLGDTNGAVDIFVRDRLNGTTERVSVDSGGVQGNAQSHAASISADGRFVAFGSAASNLVGSDTNGAEDIFVRDRLNGTTERVSVASNGLQASFGASGPSISGGGRFVSFSSFSTDLVAGDTNGSNTDVFVHDRLLGITERVSVASPGTQANSSSDVASISSDGRVVAFRSDASNLVANDTNGWGDIFVHDRGAVSAFTTFCPGDGTFGGCPCANNGNAGHGCQNSGATGGAVLTATGGASLSSDTVVLTSSSELPTALSIVLQGNSVVAHVTFGDGLRCAGGTLKRLYSKHAVGGVANAPQSGDPSISARSSTLGDTIPLGATRIYQIYYRDANITFCPGGFNVTTAIAIAWGG